MSILRPQGITQLYRAAPLLYRGIHSSPSKQTPLPAPSKLAMTASAGIESIAWISTGASIAMILPPTIPTFFSTMILAFFATRCIQPIVNTKLAVQRGTPALPPANGALITQISGFMTTEALCFKREFSKVVTDADAHRGGTIYALRGALGKALTFSGFDATTIFLESLSLGLPPLVLMPIAGLMSGAVQGTIIGFPEYLSTMQSRFRGKTNSELIHEMVDYTKKTYGAPIATSAARNAIFDAVFNTLRVGFDVPFGVAAVTSMTANYPIERARSLTQQHTDPEQIKSLFSGTKTSNGSKEDARSPMFQGWLSKAIEFLLIFQLLQLLKEKAAEEKKGIHPSVKRGLENYLKHLHDELS